MNTTSKQHVDPGVAFRKVLPAPNFMTPEVIRYGETASHIFELSSGEDFTGNPLYGVTVLDKGGYGKPDAINHELSGCFHSIEFAEAVIGDLR